MRIWVFLFNTVDAPCTRTRLAYIKDPCRVPPKKLRRKKNELLVLFICWFLGREKVFFVVVVIFSSSRRRIIILLKYALYGITYEAKLKTFKPFFSSGVFSHSYFSILFRSFGTGIILAAFVVVLANSRLSKINITLLCNIFFAFKRRKKAA